MSRYSYIVFSFLFLVFLCFFFQAEDGIRALVRSRGLGDVYKRQHGRHALPAAATGRLFVRRSNGDISMTISGTPVTGNLYSTVASLKTRLGICLLYTSDAADDLLCVDLGGRRIIKKKTDKKIV